MEKRAEEMKVDREEERKGRRRGETEECKKKSIGDERR